MYSFRELTNPNANRKEWYVIHNETGCTLPYHSKIKAYLNRDYPPVFWKWFTYSNTTRKKMKQKCTSNTFDFSKLEVSTFKSEDLVAWDNFTQAVDAMKGWKNSLVTIGGPNAAIEVKGAVNGLTISNCNIQQGQETKEQTMRNAELETRDYLDNRLHMLFYEKNRELPKFFGMRDDDRPRTRKELAERLKAGKYVIQGYVPEKDDEDEDDLYYESELFQCVRWRDPSIKEDEKGLENARKALKDAFQNAKDIVMTSDAATSLAVIKEFEAQTFH